MIASKQFTTDGSTRIFSSDFKVLSEKHFEVTIDGVEVSKSTYDVINNSAVFDIAPEADSNLVIRVGTTPDDLLTSITNIDTNNYVSGLSFNTTDGVLTATRSGLASLTVDLDGRYSLDGHTHSYLPLTGGILSGDLTVNGGDIILGGTGRIQGIDTVSADTDAASKAYVDANSGISLATVNSYDLGVGQTWQNMSASRSVGVTYTNTTGKPIQVFIHQGNDSVTTNWTGSTDYTFEFYIDGLVMYSHKENYVLPQMHFIIPNNSTYSVTVADVGVGWFELR